MLIKSEKKDESFINHYWQIQKKSPKLYQAITLYYQFIIKLILSF